MKPHRSDLRQRGFSLAEILVAVAVFAIIFIAALMIYDRSNRVFQSGVQSSNVQQATRVAFDRLVADIRMAGFDYDRDGIPTGSVAGINQYQQPDEQLEYVGQGAFTIRGNFDYETDAANQNGREAAYEPPTEQFPLVTTGNDEIVTYALMSPTAPAGNPLTFYVDSFKPRKVYPVSSGAPATERRIRIESVVNAAGQTLYVDQTNSNPPYTLYRVTLKDVDISTNDDTANLEFAPVAENIRSLTFQYYQDAAGNVPLQDLNNVVIPQASLATTVGGGTVPYNPANPADTASVTPRAIRGRIQSIRITLIGMNEAPDVNYTDPTETLAAMRPYRKYRLESLISPRNYARRGMREQEFKEPGQPTLTKVCRGYCSMFYLEWNAPAPDATKGAVESYAVLYDTDNIGGYANLVDVGNTLSAYVTVPDPEATWYFAVSAVNSYGSATSAPAMGPYPAQNSTKPQLDTTQLHASGDGHVAHPEQSGKVIMTWLTPTAPAPAAPPLTCDINAAASPAPSPTPSPVYPIQETKGFRVYRKIDKPPAGDENTDPLTDPKWSLVLDENASGPARPTFNPLTNMVTWTDTTVANCVGYWYKIRAVERCPTIAANTSGIADDNLSDISPPIFGQALSNAVPGNIQDDSFNLDYSGIPAESRCDEVANTCQAKLKWQKVQQDASGNPMVVEEYVIERKKKKGATYVGGTDTFVIDSSMYTEVAGEIQFTIFDGTQGNPFPEHDAADNNDYLYEFQVKARSCTSDGALSVMRQFPCPFTGGTVTASLDTIMQGAGTSASPWMISTPATLTVTTTNPVVYMRATVYTGISSVFVCDQSGSFTSTSCGWPVGLGDEQVFRLSIFVQDTGGCSTSVNYFVMESNSNCCLTPQSVDPAIVALDGPSGRLQIRLDNNCSEPLTIQNEGVLITWNRDLLSGTGGKRITRVVYPKPGGGTTADDGSGCFHPDGSCTQIDNNCSTSPCLASSDPTDADTNGAALTTVPANSSSYVIEIRFNRTFTVNPVTKVCIQYRRPSDDPLAVPPGVGTRTCKILPVPSNTIDACD